MVWRHSESTAARHRHECPTGSTRTLAQARASYHSAAPGMCQADPPELSVRLRPVYVGRNFSAEKKKGDKSDTCVMGVVDSMLRQSSEHMVCCNPTPTRAKDGRIAVYDSNSDWASAHNESGPIRNSVDSKPHSEKTAGSMHQPRVDGVDCCCFKAPVSNKDSAGKFNFRRYSHGFSQSDRTLQSPKPHLKGSNAIGSSSNSKQQIGERDLSTWKKDPVPLEGWSVEEQRALIEAMNNIPRDLRKRSDHRYTIFASLVRPHKPLEGRKISECEECYDHIQAKRIAFFGPIQSKPPIHHGRSPLARSER
jgi:hypothetical protein